MKKLCLAMLALIIGAFVIAPVSAVESGEKSQSCVMAESILESINSDNYCNRLYTSDSIYEQYTRHGIGFHDESGHVVNLESIYSFTVSDDCTILTGTFAGDGYLVFMNLIRGSNPDVFGTIIRVVEMKDAHGAFLLTSTGSTIYVFED